jgi:hypothetical protein
MANTTVKADYELRHSALFHLTNGHDEGTYIKVLYKKGISNLAEPSKDHDFGSQVNFSGQKIGEHIHTRRGGGRIGRAAQGQKMCGGTGDGGLSRAEKGFKTYRYHMKKGPSGKGGVLFTEHTVHSLFTKIMLVRITFFVPGLLEDAG